MSVSGNLRTMEFAELLQWLSQGRKTGTLIVDDGDVQKKLFFEKGRIVASASTRPNEQLGHFLVSQGHIRLDELSRAMDMQSDTGLLLGRILVSIGAIDEDTLRGLLVEQTEESIYDVFTWAEGEFRFLDGETIERGHIALALDVTHLTLTGFKRVDDWARIRRLIPDTRAVVVGFAIDPERIENPSDRRILEAVDDRRTIEEICLETHATEYHVCRVLLPMLETGQIKVVAPHRIESTSGAQSSEGDDEHAAASPPRESAPITAADLLVQAEQLLEEKSYREALRSLRASRSLQPEDRQLAVSVERIQRAIAEALDLDGSAVLETNLTLDQISEQPLTSEEGFLLSRIDGTLTIDRLLKIIPIDRLEGMIFLRRLLDLGYAEVRRG